MVQVPLGHPRASIGRRPCAVPLFFRSLAGTEAGALLAHRIPVRRLTSSISGLSLGLFVLLLAPSAGAEPCHSPAGVVETLAATLREAAVVDEREAVGSVVLAMFDNFGPMTDFQRRLIARLPKNVGVHLIVPPNSDYDEALRAEFPDRRIDVVEAPLDANWSRDFVPEVVIGADGRAKLVQFDYPRPESKASGAALASSLNLPLVQSEIRLDGGNILVDGARSRLLLTERTLRDNPDLTRAKIEKSLKASLGVKEIVWMPELPGEQTGHVDMFAKLLDGNTVLLARTRDPEKKKALDEAQTRLKAAGYRVRRIDLAGKGPMHECPSRIAIEHSARSIAGCDSRTLTKCGKTLSRSRRSYQARNGDFMRLQDWQGKKRGCSPAPTIQPACLGV